MSYGENSLELSRTVEIVDVKPINATIQQHLPVQIPRDITALVNYTFELWRKKTTTHLIHTGKSIGSVTLTAIPFPWAMLT